MTLIFIIYYFYLSNAFESMKKIFNAILYPQLSVTCKQNLSLKCLYIW